MDKPLTKMLFCAFAYSVFFTIQITYGQSIEQDSLRQMLAYFQKNANDEKIRQAAKDAEAAYKDKKIDHLLSTKLLLAESVLLNSNAVDKPLVLSFAMKVGERLSDLSPHG